ncbi:hypothetical protein O9992_13790 [Vibrio lentus]|nr:hypothetical protein [Vibrio lentus]
MGFGAFRFVDYKELLERKWVIATMNQVNIAVMSAIDAAVIHLIVSCMKRGMWSPGDPNVHYKIQLLLVIPKRAPTYCKQPSRQNRPCGKRIFPFILFFQPLNKILFHITSDVLDRRL